MGGGKVGVHSVTVCHRAFLRVMDGIIRRQRAKIRFFNNILTLMEKKKRFFSCFSSERRKKRLVFGGNTSETGTRIGDPEQTGAQWRYPRAAGQGTSHGRRTGAVWSTETSPAERNGQTAHLAEGVGGSGRWFILPKEWKPRADGSCRRGGSPTRRAGRSRSRHRDGGCTRQKGCGRDRCRGRCARRGSRR